VNTSIIISIKLFCANGGSFLLPVASADALKPITAIISIILIFFILTSLIINLVDFNPPTVLRKNKVIENTNMDLNPHYDAYQIFKKI